MTSYQTITFTKDNKCELCGLIATKQLNNGEWRSTVTFEGNKLDSFTCGGPSKVFSISLAIELTGSFYLQKYDPEALCDEHNEDKSKNPV